jgi:hypothetical protein
MKMYLGNGTHQNIDFQYRLPQYKNFRQQTIPIGGQIHLSGDLTEKDIDIIIQYHSIYGMVSNKEFPNYKGFFIPYIYSIDEPITADQIIALVVQNREFNTELGIKQRKEAAVTVSKVIEDQINAIPGYIGTRDRLTNLEMEVDEVATKDRDATFSEKVRVTRDRERGAPQEPDKNPLDFMASKVRKLF